MAKSVFGMLLLLWSAGYVSAEGISVSQSVDQTDMAYSDSAKFEIVLQWDGPQTAYLFDRPLNPQIEGMKVRRFASSISSSMASGTEVTIKRFLLILEPTVPGVARIEPVSISYLSWPDSVAGQLVTEAMAINITPPRTVQQAHRSGWWLWPVLVVVLGGSAAVVSYVVVRRRRRSVVPVSTPRDAVVNEILAAREEAGSSMKEFQTRVHRILLDYLRQEYGLDVAGLSDNELREKMVEAGLAGDRADRIGGWLLRAQRDKFSPPAAGPGEVVRLETELREYFEKM